MEALLEEGEAGYPHGPPCQPAAGPPQSSHSRTGLNPPVWATVGGAGGPPCPTPGGSDCFLSWVCLTCGSRLLLSRDVPSALGSSGHPGALHRAAEQRAMRPTDSVPERSSREAPAPSRWGTCFLPSLPPRSTHRRLPGAWLTASSGPLSFLALRVASHFHRHSMGSRPTARWGLSAGSGPSVLPLRLQK